LSNAISATLTSVSYSFIFCGDENNKIAVCFTTGHFIEIQDVRNAAMMCAAPQMALQLEEIFTGSKDRKLRRKIKKLLINAGYKF